MKKQQVVIIHGADSYDSYQEYLGALKRERVDAGDFKRTYIKKWKDSLADKLGAGFDVFYPQMPNSNNARYEEWKIWFEKMLKFVGPDAIYIGHSMGGIFLAKYVADGGKLRAPRAVILVAAPISCTDFTLPKNTNKLTALGNKLHLFFSKDDDIVSYQNVYKYLKIVPAAEQHLFTDRGHFIIQAFPEMVKLVKKLAK